MSPEEGVAVDAHPVTALTIARLMRPRCVEVRGCIILESRYDKANFDEWWKRLRGDRRAIEWMLNHTHLWDVLRFDDDDDGTRYESALLELGQLILDSWRSVLSEAFPARQFDFELTNTPQDYGPTISFCSKRD